MKVWEIAYSRQGDKGDISNVCVFPYKVEDWDLLRSELTVERVREKFGPLVRGEITRYEVPSVQGLNFVMTQALGGGVSWSLGIDPHGKAHQSLMLDIDI